MFLLCTKHNRSARLLATKLGLRSTISYNRLKSAPVIRYGNSNGVFDNDTMFNSVDAIKLCANNYKFSKWCKEHKFKSPIYTPYDPSKDYKYPFLLRKAYHMGGKDIKLIESKDDLAKIKGIDKLYHVPFYDTDSEVGVHIVNGKIIRVFKKVPNVNAHPFIRNMAFGYHFSIVSNLDANYQVVQKLILDLAEQVGLGFGRVDVGYNAAKKRYIIFEVNTSPGLNNNSAELYATELRMVINV